MAQIEHFWIAGIMLAVRHGLVSQGANLRFPAHCTVGMGREQYFTKPSLKNPILAYTVETAYKVYVCPKGNLLYMRIYLITDLKLL